jgi:hypothetical protein
VKLSLRLSLLFTATFLTVQLASAVTMGQIDTFQTGTDNWTAGLGPMGGPPPTPPHVMPNGGPLGAGDQFLVITADQPAGHAGSKVVAQNPAQWAGNYLAAGVTGIAMDLENLGATDLTIRLLFEDPIAGPPMDEAVTTFGASLPAGAGWTHFSFPISPSSLTTIFGNANTLLSHTTVLRIINASGPTEADTLQGVLGVDNIQAVPEPATFLLAGLALTGLGLLRRRRA